MLSEIIQTVKLVQKIDGTKNRLRPKTKVNHMNTRTTRQTIQISENAALQLRHIASEISQMVEKNKNIPIQKIHEKFKVRVGSIIANSIRESYLLGLHFVEQFAGRTTKLSFAHIEEMNIQIENQIARFWNQTEKIISDYRKKQDTPIAGAAAPFDLSILNIFNQFFAKAALSMNFLALNNSTVTTTKQVYTENIPELGIRVSGTITAPQMIWVSERDARVCPTCLNYDGRTWSVDDSTMPRPVDDSHFGCRCRLLPLDGDKVFNA
ncbi:MAG: hypothetical protein K5785_00930 [Nitrosarchaeum sp.]|nr:hypothetical protein [Nitrosarchaeum sp.]